MVAVDAGHTAMAVTHVFAKTNIGHRDHFRTFVLDCAQRFLHHTVFGISAARLFVLLFRDPKKENRLKSGVLRLLRRIDNFGERELKNARHTRDRTPFVDLFVDEKRQYKIVRGQVGFSNEISYSWGPSQTSWTMDHFSHRARLRI